MKSLVAKTGADMGSLYNAGVELSHRTSQRNADIFLLVPGVHAVMRFDDLLQRIAPMKSCRPHQYHVIGCAALCEILTGP